MTGDREYITREEFNKLIIDDSFVGQKFCNVRCNGLEKLIHIKIKDVEDKFSLSCVGIEQRIKDTIENVNQQLASIRTATEVALKANDKRLDGMNEFRDALRDAQTQFVTRSEYALQISKNTEDHDRQDALIKSLELSRSSVEGKADMKQLIWVGIVGAIGAVGSIVGIILALVR